MTSISVVANASPFGNTSNGSNGAMDVRSWLFMLVSTTTTASPSEGKPATAAADASTLADVSPEPSPQTAEHMITAWQDDKKTFDANAQQIHSDDSSVVREGGVVPRDHQPKAPPVASTPATTVAAEKVARKQTKAAKTLPRQRAASPVPSHSLSSRNGTTHQRQQHPQRESSPHSPSSPGASLRDDHHNSTMGSSHSGGGAGAASSYVLSKRAIGAQRSRDATLHEKEFWANRLRLLRREMEQVELSVAAANEFALRQGAAQVEDAIRQQLDDEQLREAKTRLERLEANRVQREAHAKSVREAHHSLLAAKRSLCQSRRQESAEAAVFVEEQHSRELHRRTLLKDAVQQEKVVQVLVRARTRALKMEETRRLYEQRIHMLQDEDEQLQAATASLIQESSRYVQKMRLLKEERSRLP